MRRVLRWFVFLIPLMCLAAVALGIWTTITLGESYGSFPEKGIFVEIPRGASVREIARTLEEYRVIRDAFAFEMLARWRRRPLLAGEYKFDQPRSAYDVYDMLAEGRVFQQMIVVPEGKTMLEIAALVEQAGFGTAQEFLAVTADPAMIRDLAPGARNLEGFLFPATYSFPRRTTARGVATAMVRRFREVWGSVPGREQPPRDLSPAQLVTLASLVERETGTANERPVIAGVFYNRLRLGMPLECDPTVIYALQLENRYRGTLYTRDLDFKSPYNTYRNRGLPPGPIANPGEAALRAVLVPEETEYLYFVADAKGSHFFSRTLREHNENVARYRRLIAPSRATQAAPPAKTNPQPAKSANPKKSPRKRSGR